MRKHRTTDPFVSSWHDPSEMQRSGTSETPNNEYAKDEMITDGGQQGLTLTQGNGFHRGIVSMVNNGIF